MRSETVRHPVEMITVGLEHDRPARLPANDDVAYALVSRFNVRMLIGKHPRWSHLEGWHLAESADYEEFWLRRLELFERVCIPSVLNLVPQPDAWFIAFGDVESWFVCALLERLRPYPWIRPYFRSKGHPDDAGPLRDLLGAFVRSLGKPIPVDFGSPLPELTDQEKTPRQASRDRRAWTPCHAARSRRNYLDSRNSPEIKG